MDWCSNSFEPNLKFVLELNEELKTKYFERHEKAKYILENFLHSLQHIFHKHQKLLADNIELSIINEKLKQIINKNESNHQKISLNSNYQFSQILESNSNCNLKITNKIPDPGEQINNKICNKSINREKENINTFVPIFSSDFLSDEDFQKQNSPPLALVKSSLVQVQSSPILCRRKKTTSKKTDLSSNSAGRITSSSESKVSLISPSSALIEKNIIETGNEFHKGCEQKNTKKNFKSIENIVQIPAEDIQNKNQGYQIISVSKNNYGKSEFLDKGKKFRQTKLTLRKVAPIIDVSKCGSIENIKSENKSQYRKENTDNETFFNCEFSYENIKTDNEENSKNKVHDALPSKQECSALKSASVEINKFALTDSQNIINKSLKDDELIETSPIQNENSKLRTKLNLNKRPNVNRTKLKTLNVQNTTKGLNLENNTKDNFTCENSCDGTKIVTKSPEFKQRNRRNSYIVSKKHKHKQLEHQKTCHDETYFSPVERTVKTNAVTLYNINSTKFEDEMKYDTPPAKKMLLNSFDTIPGRKRESPDHAYKEGPVRNKLEKAELPGWCCRDCEKWYSHLSMEEKQKRKNECSKHRGRYKADILTPESFWNPVFEDTNASFL
ncbi:PREDICTED: uncharacterized protein LOC105364389 [Ceratosolen solmsi marchali]|uniref:Uncharacterized protein LOC105364389 n=1 Tax=Ceratosolen solmsi marchali TaxID=326594 RepID=A0AAJ6YM67_9HYME|nr:PREDICTED: uncharacterized protein LOC105364389 [Ceratosolen solmsi marchali]